MLIGRLTGASLGAKISSRAMLIFTATLGLVLVFLAIFSSTDSLVNLPVLQQSATGGLSFGLAEVPINAMYLVLVGLCTSIMTEFFEGQFEGGRHQKRIDKIPVK